MQANKNILCFWISLIISHASTRYSLEPSAKFLFSYLDRPIKLLRGISFTPEIANLFKKISMPNGLTPFALNKESNLLGDKLSVRKWRKIGNLVSPCC